MQLALQLRGEKTRYADFAIEKQQERQKVGSLGIPFFYLKIKNRPSEIFSFFFISDVIFFCSPDKK